VTVCYEQHCHIDLARVVKSPVFNSKKELKEDAEATAESMDSAWEWAGVQAAAARWQSFAPGRAFEPLRPSDPSPELGYGEFKDFGADLLSTRRATLVVVADEEAKDLDKYVATYLSKWKAVGSAPEEDLHEILPELSRPDRTVWVVAEPRERGHAEVVVACHTDAEEDTTDWVLEVMLQRVLDTTLRQEAGITYGVGVGSHLTAHGHVLEIGTSVPAQAAGVALTGMLDALDQAARQEVDPGLLAQLKVELARGTVGRNQTSG